MSKLLDHINEPNDIKSLNESQLNQLAKEIRAYLVEVVSETGGHLSSNLGVVELTIALHYVFNSPYDQLVWDVGHQSYVHKILTGRKDAMKTIRQYGGLSGFNKRHESEHDSFDVGHSSTSISAALGFAAARDLYKEGNAVIAVIGDGALTAGMAFEALNNGAALDTNFIVILNDNQMSISKNVGGMAQYLDKIRTGNGYISLKQDVHKVLDHIPVIGKGMTTVIRDVKDAVKQVFIPGMFFEEMGYTYLGPIDGHSVSQVITVLRQAKRIDGPVLIHLNTIKGKGYRHAENNPTKYHGIKPFVKTSGESKKTKTIQGNSPTYGKRLSDKLTAYVEKGSPVVGISAAMPEGTGLAAFADKHPQAFFDVGIAEQHAVTFAAGLGLKGIKPYVAIYSSFLQRAYDQVLHDVCIQKVPVVFMLDRAGIVGEDGETHQGVFDLSYLSHMPNMTIMAPRDGKQFDQMMDYSLSYNRGPMAIRYPKGNAPDLDCPACEIIHGKGTVLKQGDKTAVLAVGSMVEAALKAAAMEGSDHITVADAVFVKPVDYQLVENLAKTHEHLVIIEENSVIGGLGTGVLNYIVDKELGVKVHLLGIPDRFITHGSRKELLEEVGLSPSKISDYIKELN